MVQLRLISSCLLAVAGMEDEYYHTQLLQTKLAVDDKKFHAGKALAEKALKAIETGKPVFMWSLFGRSTGPDGERGDGPPPPEGEDGPPREGGRGPPRACADEPHCSAGCMRHYAPEENAKKCMSCIDSFMDPDSEDHVSEETIAEKFKDGPDAGMKFLVEHLSECTGSDDVVAEQCPNGLGEGLHACVLCSHFEQCMPNECEDLEGCMAGNGYPPPGGLLQTKKKDEWMCTHLWPDVDPAVCGAALQTAIPEMLEMGAEVCADAEEDPTNCYAKILLDLAEGSLGLCKPKQVCKDEIGEDVNFDRCFDEGENCDPCDVEDITEDCKTCVKDACAASEDQCLKSDDDALILAQKRLTMNTHKSSKSMFPIVHAKATLFKMLIAIKK